jgi:hypothetical protein
MPIVTFDQIIEVNELLKQKNSRFKLHIRDACAGQSFWIEPLEEFLEESQFQELYKTLEEYFTQKKMTIVYTEDKHDFTVK